MNKAMVLLAGALATLSLVGPTYAQSTAPPAKEPSAPAEKPGAQRDQTTQQMTASVVSVNPDAKTLTVTAEIPSVYAVSFVDSPTARWAST